ncbi:MAG: membrane protein insertase YidC [Intestinimonas sp.]|jgi:YidC/Oxa1 family membrane protein insertase|nr:membrane protein insertase YidC [Intestinimonas sp.]
MSAIQILLTPFSWLLKVLYFTFSNYGVAIILFGLVTKIILFPLSLKGKKSMIRMNALSAKQQDIQKKFGKDRERMNQEIQKLYEKENVNPMGGCLWSMLPFPILIGLYAVIRRPFFYMMGLNDTVIGAIGSAIMGSAWTGSSGYNEMYLAEAMNKSGMLEAAKNVAGDLADKLFNIDFSFLGLNLAQVPQFNIFKYETYNWSTIGLFLIPIVSAILGFVSMKVTNKTSASATGGKSNVNSSVNKSMMITMPLMSLWIGFSMPAGLGIYWIANNVFTMLQEFIAGKMLRKDYEALAAERAAQEQQEKDEEKERRRLAAEKKAAALAGSKGKKNKKLQPAPKKKNTAAPAASRSGMRTYARGRDYDPLRFSPDGPTEYHEAVTSIDEKTQQAEQDKESPENKTPEPETEGSADETTEILSTPAEETESSVTPVVEDAGVSEAVPPELDTSVPQKSVQERSEQTPVANAGEEDELYEAPYAEPEDEPKE